MVYHKIKLSEILTGMMTIVENTVEFLVVWHS